MNDVTPDIDEIYDAALEAAEEVLRELGDTLDEPVRNTYLNRALLVLGRKARGMFLGFVHLVETDVPTAAFVLLRPAIEINLLARFLVTDPDVHLELWEAEADLELLNWIREIEADPELVELAKWPGVPATFHEEVEARIAESRKLGLDHGVKGVSGDPRKNVLPNMHDLAYVHGDLTTRHAYWAGFRPTSTHTHASSRGFLDGGWLDADGDRITFRELRDPARTLSSYRALATATYASTLTVIAEPLGLEILEPAARARDLVVSLPAVTPSEADSENTTG